MSQNWKEASEEEKILLFPLFLWWVLTVVLPLRVTEFLLTARDCLTFCKDQAFITVRRTRLKGGQHYVAYRIEEDYECFSYPVPKSLADEILWYIDATKERPQSQIGTLFVPENGSSYLTYSQLKLRLKVFLEKWKIQDNIRLGDTRHLAMISLILSGDTPSVCKALANHSKIQTSMGYYANMSLLSGCNVIRFLCDNTAASLPENRTSAFVPTKDMLRTADGYCDYQKLENGIDPFECCKYWSLESGLGNCVSCPHYHPDNPSVLIDLRSRLREDIEEDFHFLMDTIELYREEVGKKSTIEQTVLRLKSTMLRYLASLAVGYKDDKEIP